MKHMRHSLLLTLGLVMFVLPLMSSAQVEDDDLPDLLGEFVYVAMNNQVAPFQFGDPRTSDSMGFDYELIAELAERLNFEPVFIVTNWADQVDGIATGKYAVVPSVSITEQRQEVWNFSEPYMDLGTVVVVHVDDEFDSVQAILSSRRALIGVDRSSIDLITAQDVAGSNRIRLFDTVEDVVRALRAGDVRAAFIPFTQVSGIMRDYPELQLIDGVFASEEIAFLFPDNSDLVEAFDDALLQMGEDGSLDALIERWFVDFDLARMRFQ